MRPVIVAYYTRNYAPEVQKLSRNIVHYGYEHKLVAIESLGSWRNNVLFKAAFIRKMLRTLGLPVLYLDADATIERAIDFKIFKGADIGVTFFRGRILNSATIYVANTKRAIQVIEAWIARNEDFPDNLDQGNLQYVLKHNAPADLRLKILPPEYCTIETSPEVKDPVILQHQASTRIAGVKQFICSPE